MCKSSGFVEGSSPGYLHVTGRYNGNLKAIVSVNPTCKVPAGSFVDLDVQRATKDCSPEIIRLLGHVVFFTFCTAECEKTVVH